MRCSKCGFDNPDGMRFCGQCTTPLAAVCPKCQFENPPGFKFCGQCTAVLGLATVKPEPLRSSLKLRESDDSAVLDGERKTVTALFADIKGSTELMEELDPEEARALVDPALKLMIDAVKHYDGYVVQSTGDGIFALFGAPVAHEDHPQRALHAALRLQNAIRAYSAKLVADGGARIEARVGVNTGEVVVRTLTTADGHTEYTPIGHTANLASRMQAIAPTGSIAITEHTRRLVEGYFQLKPCGPTHVKGLTEPINVYEVASVGPLRTRLQRSASRGYTRFVGRQREMESLKHAAELAKAGRGQIVAAVAEPGVGKSRLFFEFKATSQSGWLVLEALSVSHGKATAYLSLIDLLNAYFRITPDDDARTRREKVAGKLTMLDRSLEQETLPHLFALLGIVVEGDDPFAQMDAQVRRRRTQDAVKRILLRESLNQPLMLIFEDLHWIDEQTQEFLNLLADSIANAKILLLVNYRPEYSHSWGSKTYYTQLRLDPLSGESAQEMLSAMLGDGKDLAPLKRLIIEKTDGTPFFMEEMVQVLFDEGVLLRNGAIKLTRSPNLLKIPPTVQGILASRMDRLPADEKDLLQTLAVFGREFPFELVKSVVGKSEDNLSRILADLQLGEFIYEQPASSDIEYIFKHALTQEVAYNSILVEKRKVLHEQTGRAIESLFRDRLDDHIEQLAYHYERSTSTEQAVKYLQLAGRQAAQRSADAQAVDYLRKGLALLQTLPNDIKRDRRELVLQMNLGPPLIAVEGYAAPAVQTAYSRARELCDRVGEDSQIFPIQYSLSIFYMVGAQHQKALEVSEWLLDFARKEQAPARQLVARIAAGVCSFWMGRLSLAHDHLQQAADLYDQERDRSLAVLYGNDMGVGCFSYLSWTLWHMGFPDQAVKVSNRALTLAEALPDSNSMGMGLCHTALLYLHLRNAHLTQHWAEAAIALASERGFAQWLAEGTIFRSWALVAQGSEIEGIREMRSGISAWQSTGGRVILPQAFAWLAEALGGSEQIDEGLVLIDEALAIADKSAERVYEAELYRIKGELLLKQGPSRLVEAVQCFRAAVELSQHQGTKLLELRATMSLARILGDQGKRDEARAMLAEIYNWFTEGFDTADLKEAKALLDELSA